MDLHKALSTYYYSSAMGNLHLMNKKILDETLTYNSLLYLEMIFSLGEHCTVSQIADLLHVSRPGVTQKVNELIRQGLVTKTSDPNDRRKHYLSVSEDAVPLYRVYHRQDDEAIARITERYTPEEIEKFCEMLTILADINFEEINNT